MQYILVSVIVLILTAVFTAAYCNREFIKVKQQADEYRELQQDCDANKEV